MPSSISNNLISLFGQRSLATTQTQLAQAVERLGSGLRINRAKDDSAGLGIGQELIKQTRSAAVAMRNAQDAISMAQTAEGALNNVSDMLGRLKELAAQGANDALSSTQRSYITQEMAQIRSEINSVANRTTFNGLSLLTGDFSQAVKGEFKDVISAVTPQSKSVLRDSITQVGAINDATVDPKVSRFSIKDIQVDSAEKGTYTINADGSSVTLTLTRADGTTKTDSVTIAASAEAALEGEAIFNNNLGESFTLDFDQLGVQIAIQNEKIGSNDRNATEIATKIAAIGLLADPDLVSNGWTTVAGAAIADASKYGLAAGATLKAVITSSEQITVTTTTGLGTVTGYSTNFQSLTTDANSGRYEIAFTGTQAQLNAALATLQVNSTDGKGDVLVDVVPSAISVYTNAATGATSYYEVVTAATNWTAARANAKLKTFMGLTGYLTNVTSVEENYFLTQKLQADAWMGASDDTALTGQAEGKWYWIDGPEAGTQILSANSNGTNRGTLVAGQYSNFNVGEPNDSSGEDYAQFYSSNKRTVTLNGTNVQVANWNDLNGTGNLQYIVEYGGLVGSAIDSSKTLLVGKPGSFEVGDGLVLRDVQLSGINTEARMNNTAGTGTFKISADASAGTVTLQQFDMDGETLLGSETISHSPLAAATGSVDLVFDQLGVSLSLENVSDRAITLGEGESGLSTEVSVATSQTASLIGADGPMFQTGHNAYSDVAANLFKDTRMGKNTDAQDKDLFNQVGSMITDLAASGENASTEAFNTLYNKLGELLDEVNARRSNLGAMQNRLQASINNVNEQAINLEAAQGQIMNTDYAAETARMTRMQIGQQAATAMLAQANQLPNVILALLQ